jgi:ribosomal protein L3 glutamine methyltransferase
VDGLDVVRRILKEAPKHLTPGGLLVVEVGATQSILEAAFPEYPFTWIQLENGGEGVFLLTQEELAEAAFRIT